MNRDEPVAEIRVLIMKVDLYSMMNGYGFCAPVSGGGDRVYFRVEDFVRLEPGEPLPIAGEVVEVPEVLLSDGRSPRASSVQRTIPPKKMQGTVKSFDSAKGWGFIERGPDLFFLHRSDLVATFTPVIGTTVEFYAGEKKGRPRACYVARV